MFRPAITDMDDLALYINLLVIQLQMRIDPHRFGCVCGSFMGRQTIAELHVLIFFLSEEQQTEQVMQSLNHPCHFFLSEEQQIEQDMHSLNHPCHFFLSEERQTEQVMHSLTHPRHFFSFGRTTNRAGYAVAD